MARAVRRWVSLVLPALLLLGSTGAEGQQSAPVAAQAARSPAEAFDRDSWRVAPCIGGVTYGAPFKLAASYGGGLVLDGEARSLCVLGVAKVGLGGAGASAGIARTIGSFGTGVALTGGVIRTFADPLNATARRTYVGGALHLWPVLVLGGEIGYYVRLGDDVGTATHGKRIVTWSAGFGF